MTTIFILRIFRSLLNVTCGNTRQEWRQSSKLFLLEGTLLLSVIFQHDCPFPDIPTCSGPFVFLQLPLSQPAVYSTAIMLSAHQLQIKNVLHQGYIQFQTHSCPSLLPIKDRDPSLSYLTHSWWENPVTKSFFSFFFFFFVLLKKECQFSLVQGQVEGNILRKIVLRQSSD